jgi:hypothetical protein
MLADELFLLLEGVRVTAQRVGPKGLGDRLVRMGEAMIKAHTKKRSISQRVDTPRRTRQKRGLRPEGDKFEDGCSAL